jgi:hypothetical protein
MLAGIEDVFIGREQAVAEEVVFEVLPGFFGGIAFWGSGGNINQGDIVRETQRLGAVPSRAVGDHGSMHLRGQRGADLVEVQLHHGGVGVGQNQADGTVARGTEGAEDIGILVARIDGHRRPRPFGGPAMGTAAFLPDAGFILAPQFNAFSGMRGGDVLECGREFFLKDATASTACAGCFGRPLIQDCPSRWSRLHTPMMLLYFTPYSRAINRCTSAARQRPTPSRPISGGTLIRAWSEASCVALNLHGRPGRFPSSRPTIPYSLYQATQCLKFSRLTPYCAHTHVRLRPSVMSRIASNRCETRPLLLQRLARTSASGGS